MAPARVGTRSAQASSAAPEIASPFPIILFIVSYPQAFAIAYSMGFRCPKIAPKEARSNIGRGRDLTPKSPHPSGEGTSEWNNALMEISDHWVLASVRAKRIGTSTQLSTANPSQRAA